MNVPLDGPGKGVTVTALGLDDAPPIEFRYTPHRRMDDGRSEPALPILILPGAVHPSVATRHERIVKADPDRRRLRRCRRIRWKFHGRRCGIHGQIGRVGGIANGPPTNFPVPRRRRSTRVRSTSPAGRCDDPPAAAATARTFGIGVSAVTSSVVVLLGSWPNVGMHPPSLPRGGERRRIPMPGPSRIPSPRGCGRIRGRRASRDCA